MSDSNELGKISKPKASNFMGKRNLLIVQLLPYIQDAPREYHDLCDRYWEAIDNQVSTMEERLGVVKRIFCDGLPGKGEDVKVALEKANPGAARFITSRTDGGAVIGEVEDSEMLMAMMDWGRCLNVIAYSRSVLETVQKSYTELSTKRAEVQAQKLNDSIKDGETALIFVSSEGTAVPGDIERFAISPPELDTAQRWLKQAAEQMSRANQQGASAPEQTDEKPSEGSGLWVPGQS